jgi:hypothetical protein
MAMKQVQQSFRFELDKNGQRRGGKRKGLDGRVWGIEIGFRMRSVLTLMNVGLCT